MEILAFIIIHLVVGLLFTLIICVLERSFEDFWLGLIMMTLLSMISTGLIKMAVAIFNWVSHWSNL